jgi:hypothetical protein
MFSRPVPLAASNLSSVSEDLTGGFAQALAAIDDAENSLLEAQTPFQKVPEQLYDWLRTL